MTTARKLTLAASYIRSAIDDVAVSSPELANQMTVLILRNIEFFRQRRPDLMGKSYNIWSH